MISDEGYSSEVRLREFMIYINFVLRKQSLYLEFITPNQHRIVCTNDFIVTFKVVTVNMIKKLMLKAQIDIKFSVAYHCFL